MLARPLWSAAQHARRARFQRPQVRIDTDCQRASTERGPHRLRTLAKRPLPGVAGPFVTGTTMRHGWFACQYCYDVRAQQARTTRVFGAIGKFFQEWRADAPLSLLLK